VGRGAEQSYCLLVSGPKEELTESAHDRLEAMVASTDGFELAEKDLEIRGGGALLGARQSGLSDLRFARITHDRDLLEQARDAAAALPPETMAPEVDALLGSAGHLGDS
jgi:ATP-dependent DNA helicase RecG